MIARAILYAAAVSLAATAVHAQERAEAAVTCVPGDGRLAYDCEAHIVSRGTQEPIEGLTVEVKADMPSMPLAHNIPPVMAEPGGEAGVYAFSLVLDMHGVWSFSMRISGPREDLVVELLDFQPDMEQITSGAEPGSGHGHAHGHGHGEDDGHGHSHD